ncbi:MAG: hypothetical protein LBS96_02450 [Oscillospiraceae bacterium]|jgi:hypothetical protein|nr:hypothetical protein [Oscillospiraceae bacterium]
MATPQTPEKQKANFSSFMVLVLTGILAAFTAACLALAFKDKTVPEYLIISVFGFCTGECGLMAWIKTSKVKHSTDSPPAKDFESSEEA